MSYNLMNFYEMNKKLRDIRNIQYKNSSSKRI